MLFFIYFWLLGHTLWCSGLSLCSQESRLGNHMWFRGWNLGQQCEGKCLNTCTFSLALCNELPKTCSHLLANSCLSKFCSCHYPNGSFYHSPSVVLILKSECRGVGVEQCLQEPRAYSFLRVGVPVLPPSAFPFSLHLFRNSVPSALPLGDSGPEIALIFLLF